MTHAEQQARYFAGHRDAINERRRARWPQRKDAINAERRGHRPPSPGASLVDAVDRFWAKVVRRGPDECWEWTGATAGRPGERYGQMRWGTGHDLAHRIAYELLVGPIPEGLVIDHLCRNRTCVNPAHLEPVTQQVNILRGTGRSARFARQTVCLRGHPFVVRVIAGRIRRDCNRCNSLRRTARRERARAAHTPDGSCMTVIERQLAEQRGTRP